MIGWEFRRMADEFRRLILWTVCKLTYADGKQNYLSKYPGEPKNRHLQRQRTIDSKIAYESATNIYLLRKEDQTFRPDAL